MPYKEEWVDDFECNLLCCTCNESGNCVTSADIDDLSADETRCSCFIFVDNREFITRNEHEVDSLVYICEEREIKYKVIDPESNRLVLKTINNKGGLFRISKDSEKVLYFFSSIEGGVDYVHESVREADLFSQKE